MHLLIYEDNEIYIQKHESEIPWLKIFTQEPYKELGDVPKELRTRLWDVYDLIEDEMKKYYNPKKINMASFSNILPRVHIHVMARFEDDSYFPEPMWGTKQREANLKLPNEQDFYKITLQKLNSLSTLG